MGAARVALGAVASLTAACAPHRQPVALPPSPMEAAAAAPSGQPPPAERAASPPAASPPAAPAGAAPAAVDSTRSCPEGMALARRPKGAYCIDRWEATLERLAPDGTATRWPGHRAIDGQEQAFRAVSVPGLKPQGYVSGKQAQVVCRNAGKRLCAIDEWVTACRGPRLTTYPYGEERRKDVCNDRFRVLDHHPIPILFRKHAPPGTDPKLMWHPRWMDDDRIHSMPHTVVPTGEKSGCTNELGVFDMVGNLHEWVADDEGTFFGGFFMDTFQNGEGCGYRTIAHPFDYHDYSTGFRCCADALAVTAPP